MECIVSPINLQEELKYPSPILQLESNLDVLQKLIEKLHFTLTSVAECQEEVIL